MEAFASRIAREKDSLEEESGELQRRARVAQEECEVLSQSLAYKENELAEAQRELE